MILGAMDQKLWVFEVFGQDLAKAGMCNQQELTTCAKSGGQKKKKKKTVCPCPCVDLQGNDLGSATSGCQPEVARQLWVDT
jgi:hypothetical protein